MSKLSESLQRTSESLTADMLPSWTSVIVTLAPIAIRALWQRKLRKDLKKDIRSHLDNYMNEYRAPLKAAQMERKKIRRGQKLDVMKQSQFDALKIVDGKRVCPPGYDYSDIEPGEMPCYFSEDVTLLKKGRVNKSYLGGAKTWPPNSYMGNTTIVGSHSTIGENTVVRDCYILNNVNIKARCIGKDCVIGDSCDIGAGFVGIGGVVFGHGNKFGHSVDLRPPKGSGVGGYHLGNDAVIGSNFKMHGTNNVIGHNASIGSLCDIKDADIHRNNLTVATGGVLKSCRLVAGAGDYEAPYKINKCHIEGTNSKPFLMAEKGSINNCVIEGNVLGASECVYNKCDMLDMPHISKNSELTDCNVSSQNVCHIGENTIMHGGSLNGAVVEGSEENINRLIDVDITNSELSYTHIEDDSMCSDVELGPGCEVRGEVELDRTVTLTHDIKFRDYRLNGEFSPTPHNGVNVSFYRLNVMGDTLSLHKSKKDSVNYKLFNSDLSKVESVIANINHVTFGKGVYDGDVISPESNASVGRNAGHSKVMSRHKQQVDESEKLAAKKQAEKASNQNSNPEQDNAHHYEEPPLGSYDSVSLDSVSNNNEAQMNYADYENALKAEKGGRVNKRVVKGVDAKSALGDNDIMSVIEENDRLKAQESEEKRQQPSSRFGS